MATRVKVTGMYLNPSTYVLKTDNGEVIQTINENVPFKIGNQMKEWIPVKVKKRAGRGTVLICKKHDVSGKVIDQFTLIHNKIGLWALTSGAARNGVFHKCNIQKSFLEENLEKLKIPMSCVQIVDKLSNTRIGIINNGGVITDKENYKIVFTGHGFKKNIKKIYITVYSNEIEVVKIIKELLKKK